MGTQALILKHRGAHSFCIKLMKPDSLASIMNWSKNLYVFMLGSLIVFSGCFGTGTTDGEGDDDAVGTTVINYYNNSTSTNEPIWYTSGGTFAIYWDDPARDNQGYGCDGWSAVYHSSNGTYSHDECDSWSHAENVHDWNETFCGGVLDSEWTRQPWIPASSYSPRCKVNFTTINTLSGEVLSIYQMDGSLTVSTTCGGVTTDSASDASLTGREYLIVTGGAMDCSHTLYRELSQSDDNDAMDIWSIVYAIQDATVV